MTQKIIFEDEMDDKTRIKILQFIIKDLEKENNRLQELVDKSQILHLNDNFRVAKEAKANDIIVHFTADGRQLPF